MTDRTGCSHCNYNHWLGGDIECVNGVMIDIDEAHEGPIDVCHPVAPCHPNWADQDAGRDFPDDSIERLNVWRAKGQAE